VAVKQRIPAHNSLGLLYCKLFSSDRYVGPGIFYQTLLVFKELRICTIIKSFLRARCHLLYEQRWVKSTFFIIIFKPGQHCQEAVWFVFCGDFLLMPYLPQVNFAVIFLVWAKQEPYTAEPWWECRAASALTPVRSPPWRSPDGTDVKCQLCWLLLTFLCLPQKSQ